MVDVAAVSSKLDCRPITPTFGAEIHDLDTKSPLGHSVVEELKSLLMTYKVLFFREQHLDYDEQERFAAQFGPPRIDPLEDWVPNHPGLATLDNVPYFHSDWMNAEAPTQWSVLQMKVVPPIGGDTMFADLVASYDALSEPLRRFLEQLHVRQSINSYAGDGSALAHFFHERSGGDYDEILRRVQPRLQPLVRYIPETRRANYWVSRSYSKGIEELSPTESAALLDFLFQHQLLPQFVIRWSWCAGDLAFWDHRTTLHSGVKDYGEAKRHGCRASITGIPLIAVADAPRS